METRRNVIISNRTDKIIISTKEIPRFNSSEIIVLKLNKIPKIRNIKIVKKLICKIYGIPYSTLFNKNFSLVRPILKIGENNSLNDTLITGSGVIKIGNNCSFSHRNFIVSSSHNIDDFNKLTLRPVTIGDNVWITSNVTILGGVNIGSNTIIGAGSVVTHDIPAGVFAAGNPCKVIKQIDFRK